MGMTLEDLYTTRAGVPAGPAQSSPAPGVAVSQQISSPATGASDASAIGAANIAPTFSWLAIVGALVLIRVLWERGARPGGSIAGE